jgi:hypothetical protein
LTTLVFRMRPNASECEAACETECEAACETECEAACETECEAACETPRAYLGPRCPLIMSRRHSRLGAVAIAFASGLSEPVGALATLVLLQSVVTQVTHKGPCPSVFSVCLRSFPKEFR